ncbi:MAG: PfkB family carbohydrate kinase [bacterium]
MILTVTLNPLLEKRLFFNKINFGGSNRSANEILKGGGKGINVSRQLGYLGALNSSFTFLGGNNGKVIRHIMAEEKINFTFVPTKSETRYSVLIIEESTGALTNYFSPNNEIQITEAEEFKSKLDKAIQNCSTVIFSGSSPAKETNDIFPYGIKLADKYDKISILDTYGDHLPDCIDAGPTAIHNCVDELESSLNISLTDEKDKIDFMDSLYKKNIKLSFLTDGANPIYASKYDFHYKVDVPKIKVIDPTGSGDAFTAGIAFGLEEAFVFEDMLKTAAALGTANAASWEICTATKDESQKYYDVMKIVPIGKKMKLIDDSPTQI